MKNSNFEVSEIGLFETKKCKKLSSLFLIVKDMEAGISDSALGPLREALAKALRTAEAHERQKGPQQTRLTHIHTYTHTSGELGLGLWSLGKN